MNEIINSEKYCAQLNTLKTEIGKNFVNLNYIQKSHGFSSKPEGFYRTGIEKLRGRWQKILDL